jgi:hypothetical protein
MKPAKETKFDNDPTTRLLQEGARTYLEAVTALMEYQKEVQKKCREVLRRHLEDYSAALKVKDQLEEKEIGNWAGPKFEEWAGDWWNLGVHIDRKTPIPTIPGWETCCGLGFEDSQLICFVGELFSTKKIASVLHQHFHRLKPNLKVEPYGIWSYKTIGEDEGGTFDKPLEGVLEEWIQLWKTVGGMEEVFKA